MLTLSGLGLLVGSSHRVTVGGEECAVVRYVGRGGEGWGGGAYYAYFACVCVYMHLCVYTCV